MIDKTQTSRRSPPLFDESNQGLVKLKDATLSVLRQCHISGFL